jgi:hypothetical protein
MPLDVRLSSGRPSYLLGEAVTLRIVASNVGQEVVRGREMPIPPISVYISHDAKGYERYDPQIGMPFHPDTWPLVTLPPGEALHYLLHPLYMRQHQSRLAFEHAGDYSIKAHFGLRGVDPESSGIGPLESNTIQITIQEPQGADAKLWQTLRQEPYLRFLHLGWYRKDEGHIPIRLATMLLQDPTSGYVPTIRDALARYYQSQQSYEDMEQREDLRRVLGIEPNVLFPDDERLARTFVIEHPNDMLLKDVVQLVSEWSGVPLSVSPEAPPSRLRSLKREIDVRTFMRQQSSSVTWERHGEGYRLVLTMFPDDRRLGSGAILYFAEPTPLADVLRQYTQQRHVSFKASPDLQDHKVQLAVETDDRTILRRLAEMTGATWVRRGEGYYLTRQPDEAEPAPENATNPDADP